jgi:hypothetical protein
MSRLFKGSTIVLTVIVAIVIIWLAANLVRSRLELANSYVVGFEQGLVYVLMLRDTRLLLIANAIEIALVWLLVLLDVLSRRQGLITTLVLVSLVGIAAFMTYSLVPVGLTLSRDVSELLIQH